MLSTAAIISLLTVAVTCEHTREEGGGRGGARGGGRGRKLTDYFPQL